MSGGDFVAQILWHVAWPIRTREGFQAVTLPFFIVYAVKLGLPRRGGVAMEPVCCGGADGIDRGDMCRRLMAQFPASDMFLSPMKNSLAVPLSFTWLS